MHEPRTVVLSANPQSGSSSGVERAQGLRDALAQAGFMAELFTDIKPMAERVRALHAAGDLRCVVSGGGDGTASLVLSLIPQGVPVCLFPLGSENLLAQYFEIDTNVERTVQRIALGKTQAMDLFRANDRLSLLVTSVGFDAEVVRSVHLNRTSHVTRWSYRWAILKAMASYRWPTLRVELRDTMGEWGPAIQCNWLFAFNVPKYAAGLCIVDTGEIDDGLLEIGLFHGGGLCRGLWHYGLVQRRVHHRHTAWTRLQATGLRVAMAEPGSSNAAVPYQTDGDWGGDLPLEMTDAGYDALMMVDPEWRVPQSATE